MTEQKTPIACALPPGWSAFAHVLRGYDSPDRWLSATHENGRQVTALNLDDLRRAIDRTGL